MYEPPQPGATHRGHSQPLEPVQPAASGVKTGAAEGRQKDRILRNEPMGESKPVREAVWSRRGD